MTSITINKHFEMATCEINEDGSQPAGYWALNASGKGEVVALVAGPVELADMGYGAEGGKIGDDVYALRDVLAFARRGERGLSVIVDHAKPAVAAQPAFAVTEPYHKGDLGQF